LKPSPAAGSLDIGQGVILNVGETLYLFLNKAAKGQISLTARLRYEPMVFMWSDGKLSLPAAAHCGQRC
jgi:hypothetical protein